VDDGVAVIVDAAGEQKGSKFQRIRVPFYATGFPLLSQTAAPEPRERVLPFLISTVMDLALRDQISNTDLPGAPSGTITPPLRKGKPRQIKRKQ